MSGYNFGLVSYTAIPFAVDCYWYIGRWAERWIHLLIVVWYAVCSCAAVRGACGACLSTLLACWLGCQVARSGVLESLLAWPFPGEEKHCWPADLFLCDQGVPLVKLQRLRNRSGSETALHLLAIERAAGRLGPSL